MWIATLLDFIGTPATLLTVMEVVAYAAVDRKGATVTFSPFKGGFASFLFKWSQLSQREASPGALCNDSKRLLSKSV